jgi:glycosyltransferase involved in cell wall biosynthesis
MTRILVDSLADAALTNAQMVNAREIICRLDPAHFHVTTFFVGDPDPRVADRPATRLIKLPPRRQTPVILAQFLRGDHDLIFYLKSSPAAKWFLRSRALGRRRRPTIGTVESQCDLRNEPTVTPQTARLWEQTVLHCDYLFSNSRSVQRSLQSEYGLASEIVPTGVDTKFFTPDWERPANARPRVLFVGSLRPFKGPQLVLDAAARFSHADFVLVGTGSMEQELRARAGHDGLKNVHFTGSISLAAVRAEYHKSDVFFFPSAWEGSPKVILEASACGLPVIASNNYQPETVIDGQTGFLASRPDEFLVDLAKLLSDPRLCREMGRAGRQHSKNFDWDLIASQWEEVFGRVASSNLRRERRVAAAASF